MSFMLALTRESMTDKVSLSLRKGKSRKKALSHSTLRHSRVKKPVVLLLLLAAPLLEKMLVTSAKKRDTIKGTAQAF